MGEGARPQALRDCCTLAPVPESPLPGWSPLRSGKVRDVLVSDSDDQQLLVVASDRVSAYDHVLATPVPDKGAILTALSLWWFERLDEWGLGVGHHVLDAAPVADGGSVPDAVAGRAMVCRRLAMVPVECVARGWLTGSALADYRATGAVSGVELPDGLGDGDRLGAAVFTPATKAPAGEHDENTTYAAVATELGEPLAGALREVTLAVYERAAALVAERGLVLADTKLELGHDTDGALVVGDELLTPDSSRYWLSAPGPRTSLDKQHLRDWLTSSASGWDRGGTRPPPPLPEEVVAGVRDRYVRAYERITGRAWP